MYKTKKPFRLNYFFFFFSLQYLKTFSFRNKRMQVILPDNDVFVTETGIKPLVMLKLVFVINES